MNNWQRFEQQRALLPMKEIDYRALRLMLERSEGPNLLKRREINRFDRAWKRGLLHYAEGETALQKWMRCEARFTLGDYSDWSGWQYRDKWAERTWFQNPFKVPVWKVEPVGRLYIIGEQGLGDEILLSQSILNAQQLAGEIVFETQDRLQTIFERSFGVKTRKAIVGADFIRRAQPFEADAWVALGELPRVFRRKQEDFIRKAYITPAPDRIDEMAVYREKVGLSWRGAQGRIDYEKLKKMYPDHISLQYDQSEESVEKPHIDLKNDLEGVLALISVLKKVVSVSTTVAHLAASSGAQVDLVIADRHSGIRRNILPWRWLDLNQKTIPRKAWWYGDNVSVYLNWGEYFAHVG